MGLLNRSDSTIFRDYFKEMCKLIGISVTYQYIEKREITIHSEDNSTLSQPIRLDILLDEHPKLDTLNKLGWLSELNEQHPMIVHLPYDTPNLTVDARITIESIDGLARPRVYRITRIKNDLEYPESYTCTIAPVVDQIPQNNHYNSINYEKLNTDASKRTPVEDKTKYPNFTSAVDTIIDKEDDFIFNENNSQYSN